MKKKLEEQININQFDSKKSKKERVKVYYLLNKKVKIVLS